MKSQVMTLTRQFFSDEGFLDVETPMLGKTTPEGGGIILYQAVFIRDLSTDSHSLHSFINSF